MKIKILTLILVASLFPDLCGESIRLNPKYLDKSITPDSISAVNKALEKYPLKIVPTTGKKLLLKKPNSWHKLWGNTVDGQTQIIALSWKENEYIYVLLSYMKNSFESFNKIIIMSYYKYIPASRINSWGTDDDIKIVGAVKANFFHIIFRH